MSDVVNIVNELDLKIQKMIFKMQELEKNNEALRSELNFYKDRFAQTGMEMEELQNEVSLLKAANALLGSEEFKRETKIRINSIIREIDYCIAQLSD